LGVLLYWGRMAEGSEEEERFIVPARFNERFFAYLIDLAPFALGYLASVNYLLDTVKLPPLAAVGGFIGAYVLYHTVGVLAGGTVGKRLLGLRVVTTGAEGVGPVRAFIRAVGQVLGTPLMNWGFVLALFHPENRAFHDVLSGTVVIETRESSPAGAAVKFLLAALTLCGLYIMTFWVHVLRPTPKDLAAIEDAKKGLMIMAQIQESWRAGHDAYADKIEDLAEASGDPDQFAFAVRDLFHHESGINLEAGNRRYRIEGSAKDRFRTRLLLIGPPPEVRKAK
jgi:uncharacterized RDD family membrane protein YckC